MASWAASGRGTSSVVGRSTRSLAVMEAAVTHETLGTAQKIARASQAVTIVGLGFLALIILLPASWFRPVEWIVLLYVLLAAIASLLAIVAAYWKQSAKVAARVIVLVGINAIGVVGVAFVFFTFRMEAP